MSRKRKEFIKEVTAARGSLTPSGFTAAAVVGSLVGAPRSFAGAVLAGWEGKGGRGW